jgi:hypothetical protein
MMKYKFRFKLYFWIIVSILWSFFEIAHVVIFNKISKINRYISAKINNEV